MSAGRRIVGPALLVLGAGLLAEAVASGGAHLYLVLILPVFTGAGLWFGSAILCLVVGVLLLPWTLTGEVAADAPTAPPTAESPPPPGNAGSSGGLVLIGPIPIFFGAWKAHPPIGYRWAVVLGLVLLLLAVLALWILGSL